MAMVSAKPLDPLIIAVRTQRECLKRGVKIALYRYSDDMILRGWEFQMPMLEKHDLIGVYDEHADIEAIAADIRDAYPKGYLTVRHSGAGLPNAKGAPA